MHQCSTAMPSPLSKKFDFRWTRFREFEPKMEGRRINTVRDSSHLFSSYWCTI